MEETGGKEIGTELSREMGLLYVTMIGVGAMIGAGIFVLTGIAAGEAGPALLLAFLLNGLVTGLTALSYAELGSCLPGAGGGYLWIKEALPQPNGFLSGWMSWFAQSVACSLYSLAFGTFTIEILIKMGVDLPGFFSVLGLGRPDPYILPKFMAVIVTALFGYINYRGAEETGIAETFVTIIKIIIIGLFIAFGLYAMLHSNINWQVHFADFFPRGAGGVVIAMGLTFIAFEGYEIIAQCGEEVVRPKRNIPLSIGLSLIIVIPIYLLVAFVAIGAIDVPDRPTWQYLGEYKELAMIEAADHFMPWGALIFLVGGLFSTMSALNATIYSSSRVFFAMARDHNMPNIFGAVHKVRKTPHWAVIISGIFIASMAVALPIEDIASAADTMFLLLFLMVNIAVINLRKNRPDLARGFRVPLCPLLPLIAIVTNFFLAAFLFLYSPKGIMVTCSYIIAGIFIYYVYAHRKEEEAKKLPVLFETMSLVPEQDYNILAPIANPASVEGIMEFASIIAKHREGNIIVLNVLQIPAQLPPSRAIHLVPKAKEFNSLALDVLEKRNLPGRALIKVGHNIPYAINETAHQHHINMMVLGWLGHVKRRDYVFGTVLDEIIMNAPCDMVMIRKPVKGFLQKVKRILIPVSELHHADFSLRLGEILAKEIKGRCTILHVSKNETGNNNIGEEKELFLTQLAEVTKDFDSNPFDLIVEKGANVIGAILEELRPDDLLIINASREGLIRRALFGEIPESLSRIVKGPVIFTKRYSGDIMTWFQRFFGSRKSILE